MWYLDTLRHPIVFLGVLSMYYHAIYNKGVLAIFLHTLHKKSPCFFLNNLFRRNKFWKFCKDCFDGMEFLQHFKSKKRVLPIFHNSHVVNKWLRKSKDTFNVMPRDTLWGLFCFGRHFLVSFHWLCLIECMQVKTL